MNRRELLLAAAGTSVRADYAATSSVVHHLRVGEELTRFDRLVPGERTYVRYVQRSSTATVIDVWRRVLSLEDVQGQPRLVLRQRWDRAGSQIGHSERESVFELGTLRPMNHVRSISQPERGVVRERYEFAPDIVEGQSVRDGEEPRQVRQDLAEPVFNFEADMELLQALPLTSGYAVSIPFYDPGGSAPDRYEWRVVEDASLSIPPFQDLQCWLLEADYNGQVSPPARFWVEKKTQVLLRQQVAGSDGSLMMKVLLPT